MIKRKLQEVREKNKKINDLIKKIIEYRRQKGITIDGKKDIEIVAKKIFEIEMKKCLLVYKAEYSRLGFSHCRGPSTVTYVDDTRKMGDCYGGMDGLQICPRLNKFLEKAVYSRLKVESFEKNEESQKHDGSARDQIDFFIELYEKNGIDMDWVMGALAHEATHIYGVNSGNDFLKEGITEQLTRESSDKYGIYMSPTSHTQESNFIRKLELIVGRDEIIKAGLYDRHINFENTQMFELAEQYGIPETKLSKIFKIMTYGEEKRTEEQKAELMEFQKEQSELYEKFTKVLITFNELKNKRYDNLIKAMSLKIPGVDFKKMFEDLDYIYGIQKKNKSKPNFCRQLYTNKFSEILNKEDLENLKGIESYEDLIVPIMDYINNNNLDIEKDRKEMLEVEPTNLDPIIELQEKELIFLEYICMMYKINRNDIIHNEGFYFEYNR